MPAYSFSLSGIYDFFRFSTLYLPTFSTFWIFRPVGLFINAAPALTRRMIVRAIALLPLVYRNALGLYIMSRF